MKRFSRLIRIGAEARALWDESALRSHTELTRLHKIAHLCLMICRSFVRNRCPLRASALAYTSLLALIPMLAVVMSVSSTFLKKEGEERIDQFIGKVVASLVPPADLGTNSLTGGSEGPHPTNATPEITSFSTSDSTTNSAGARPSSGATSSEIAIAQGILGDQERSVVAVPRDGHASASGDEGAQAIKARKVISHRIHEFIQNTRSGTLGVTGSVLLIFVAISMLSRIEDTFNDIWGVTCGRGWFTRIVVYWSVISLVPLLLGVALGLANGPHLQWTRHMATAMPLASKLFFDVLPIVIVCVAFTLFYIVVPNTKVRWRAALAGGIAGGLLFHLNNMASALYVSRVVSNSRVYGSLGLVPVFMIGLYLFWLILLFGAQVAYAFQNRTSYLEEKQIENINQRGREFIALRLLTFIGQRYVAGEPPPAVLDLGQQMGIPSRLVQQLTATLCSARLVREVAGPELAYVPARPLETITCHDVLLALRAGKGQELATREEPARHEVLGEYQRIQDAERDVASAVSILVLVNRAARKQLDITQPIQHSVL